ncbi:MAG: hypothetical protein LBH77_10505 [Tannerella sp.]|jgi:hypothetical protein|nr:hypothetical protein [Tannerella sp.]
MEIISISQIGLYNPQRQSHEVTKKLFVVRQKQFHLLFEKILQEDDNSIPQHYLIVGQRGMGKTTMLKRIQVEFYKHERFIPILFSEEQYNVKDLAEFWLNCLDALADSLELEQYNAEQVKNIDDKVKELSVKEFQTISEDAYQFLMTVCREVHRRPVLLVDNIGLILHRLNKSGQHVLRALLSENGAPVVVGADVTVTDDVVRYDMPFYDFFQIQYLKKLSFEEFTELLKNLATVTGSDDKVLLSIQKNIPRQKTLLALTGGNPRTTVMLYKLIVNGFSKDINDDLEALTDEATPLYKAKYEDLPMQQQIIIDAIAMNWDAIPLNKLATVTRMKNNQLSPQLKRLIDDGWIETTSAYKAKGNAYLISERFFNIWFLMRRSSRRQKEQIHCLSIFLEYFYGKDICETALNLSSINRFENTKNGYDGKMLGDSYVAVKKYKEAEKAYLQSISLENNVFTKYSLMVLYRDNLNMLAEAELLFNTISVELQEEKQLYFINKSLFELYRQNLGQAKFFLQDCLKSVKENEPYFTKYVGGNDEWCRYAAMTLKLNYGSWLLKVLAEKGFDKILSPYFVAIQAIEIAHTESAEKSEIYLKNRAVEIAEPARIIIEKIKMQAM